MVLRSWQNNFWIQDFPVVTKNDVIMLSKSKCVHTSLSYLVLVCFRILALLMQSNHLNSNALAHKFYNLVSNFNIETQFKSNASAHCKFFLNGCIFTFP